MQFYDLEGGEIIDVTLLDGAQAPDATPGAGGPNTTTNRIAVYIQSSSHKPEKYKISPVSRQVLVALQHASFLDSRQQV